MTKKAISTEDAPAAIGAYAQAVTEDGWLYCSGQIPVDPRSGELIGQGDVRAQTDRVMKNLAAVLQAAGAGFADVVKATVYLSDLSDFATFNEVYAEHFRDTTPPARACVGVAALPTGALVEIDLVAKIPPC